MSTRPAVAERSDTAAERVRRYYRHVDAHEIDALLDLFADDAVYARPGYEPLNGRAEIENFYRAERVITSGRHTVCSVLVDGAQVAVHGEFAGTVRTGEQVGLRFADFFVLDETGRFTRRDTFFFAPLV